MLNKIVLNSRKTSESYKTQGKVFNKNCERFFRRTLSEFSENVKINRKPWENDFGLIS